LATNPRGTFLHGWPKDITVEAVIAASKVILTTLRPM
jgi:hypothetical protein